MLCWNFFITVKFHLIDRLRTFFFVIVVLKSSPILTDFIFIGIDLFEFSFQYLERIVVAAELIGIVSSLFVITFLECIGTIVSQKFDFGVSENILVFFGSLE